MLTVFKSREQIEAMRRTGRVVAQVILKMRQAAMPGVSTAYLDAIAAQELASARATSIAKDFPTYQPGEGFPGHTCICVNDEVVHGVPGPRVLHSGDIVTLDVNASLSGFCASAATTVAVGQVPEEVSRFLQTGVQALRRAIEQVRPNRNWHEIAAMIQQTVEGNGYAIVREYGGHGIGRRNMEEPLVLNYRDSRTHRSDFRLRPGMTITIEPMITMGRRDIVLREDGWTVATADGYPAAHFRHTIAVTLAGADILTL